MTKKQKRWIIIGSVLVGLLGLIILLSFTVFSLKSVSIDFRTSYTKLEAEEKIVESGNFKIGGSVFFHGKKGYKAKLENEYPYLKVVNIETVFPSKFVVHVKERQEVYFVKNDTQTFVCDEEFRVLRIAENEENTPSNSILIENPEFEKNNFSSVKIGDYLKGDDLGLFSCFYENNRLLGQCQEMIKKATIFTEHNNDTNLDEKMISLEFWNGQTYLIQNVTYGLKYKVSLLLKVFSQVYQFVGKDIVLSNGETFTLTEASLEKATIIIKNYYDWRSHDEKDCYFDILPVIENSDTDSGTGDVEN